MTPTTSPQRSRKEALELLEDPGSAYQLATPVIRRMFNQALFEKLLVVRGDVMDATPMPWVSALQSVAREAAIAGNTEDADLADQARQVVPDRARPETTMAPRIGAMV